MNYIELTLSGLEQSLHEILIAELSALDFNGFLEEDYQLIAYIEEGIYPVQAKAKVEALAAKYQFQITTKTLADQNWNAQWEADYQPVIVEDFCVVRASFHPPMKETLHELIVTPKMSFGTGHHATTYMMILQMRDLDFQQKKVLDYGCGTGVLAILAQKLGAELIDAVDIDYWSYENTLENRSLNQVPEEALEVYHGELAAVPMQSYDLILANINRNVILGTMSHMSARLNTNGQLLCSGFLEQDIPLIVAAAQEQGLQPKRQETREQWQCLLFGK